MPRTRSDVSRGASSRRSEGPAPPRRPLCSPAGAASAEEVRAFTLDLGGPGDDVPEWMGRRGNKCKAFVHATKIRRFPVRVLTLPPPNS